MRGKCWLLCLQVFSGWLLVAEPGICSSSFSGIVRSDSGSPVPDATVYWNNQIVCVRRDQYHTTCYGPTLSGSTKTGSDGSFAALDLPADTYTVCVIPLSGNLLSSCEFPAPGASSRITLGENENRTGVQTVLLTGSLVVITVNDPFNATSTNRFAPSVVVGSGGYYAATYDANRRAYTRLIPKGVTAQLFIDTLLIVQDRDGNSLPVDDSILPFTAGGDEVPFSVNVTPALVNAANYVPGVDEGTIATLFGSGFTDIPGLHQASGLPLPAEILGTTVTVNGTAAPLLGVADQNREDQINFQVPHLPSFGNGLLEIVVANNGKSQTFYTRRWDQLGIFSTLFHSSGDPITATSPSAPGEEITIQWTGMSGDNFVYSAGVIPDGVPYPPFTPCVSYFNPQVQFGDVLADVSSCSSAPGLVGIGQLVVTVPPGLASGDYDVAVMLSNARGNVVRLPVRIP